MGSFFFVSLMISTNSCCHCWHSWGISSSVRPMALHFSFGMCGIHSWTFSLNCFCKAHTCSSIESLDSTSLLVEPLLFLLSLKTIAHSLLLAIHHWILYPMVWIPHLFMHDNIPLKSGINCTLPIICITIDASNSFHSCGMHKSYVHWMSSQFYSDHVLPTVSTILCTLSLMRSSYLHSRASWLALQQFYYAFSIYFSLLVSLIWLSKLLYSCIWLLSLLQSSLKLFFWHQYFWQISQ